MRYNIPVLERYTVLDNECWQWNGYIDKGGYGIAWLDSKNQYAHRIFYSHYNGEIDSKLTIDHLCRNRSCVNPTHLEQVSLSVNAKRAIEFNGSEYCKSGHIKDKVKTLRGYSFKFCSVCKNEYERNYRKLRVNK